MHIFILASQCWGSEGLSHPSPYHLPPACVSFWGLFYLSMVRALSRTLSPQRPSLELETCFRHGDPPVSSPVFIAKCLFLLPWAGLSQNLGGSRPTVTIIYIYFPFTKDSDACESRASRACFKPMGYSNPTNLSTLSASQPRMNECPRLWRDRQSRTLNSPGTIDRLRPITPSPLPTYLPTHPSESGTVPPACARVVRTSKYSASLVTTSKGRHAHGDGMGRQARIGCYAAVGVFCKGRGIFFCAEPTSEDCESQTRVSHHPWESCHRHRNRR
ncbi:hypothetical protein QBC33DRAFT_79264 [Phialemonium atrogriseum]|uniref:Uncharacterized protein n=1 Tax=Phialemonium atrogriseum TaxID=1093897 RepID=A0AAJ0BZF9_9PEZI|nr:uncharacterized protein QBC33DRAFT_79264 [Phialemonium atrogriseum]KAK1767140.1 hypothetical protein QBC33DRAFT_79264 [Phialemonium atrogriseum]